MRRQQLTLTAYEKLVLRTPGYILFKAPQPSVAQRMDTMLAHARRRFKKERKS